MLKEYLAEEQEIANMEADIKEFEYKNGYWIKWYDYDYFGDDFNDDHDGS